MSAVVQDSAAVVQVVPSPVQVVDVAALIAPLSAENASGENLQYSEVYDEIREARRADDNLAQGDWQREPKLAEWAKVVDLSSNALATRTKDLQIAAWLTEALVELHGFVGLRDGLKVMRALHENFWDTVFPLAEDGDLEARANAVSFMDGKVEIPLKKLSLTNSGTGIDYSYLQWEESTKFDIPENIESLEASAYERMSALKQQAEDEGKTTGEAWRKAKDSTRRAFYETTNLVLNESWEEFQALDRVMDERFGRQTPGLGALKKALESIRSLVDKLVKEKRILEPDPIPVTAGADGNSSADGGTRMAGGPINTRADALRQLAEVAEYFKRAEPHSPVSYLVQRAIKWGQMPLEVWLEDVIKDGNVLGQLREVLGFGTTDQSSQS
ncbi:MAG: type VI secretion system protein TssA [Pyrinomonadaceae bacterium]